MIRLKNRLRRQWQITSDPALKAKANWLPRALTRQLNAWRNDHCSATMESLDPEDQSLWRMTKRVMRVPTSSPPQVNRRLKSSRTPRNLKAWSIVWKLIFSR